MKHTEYTEYETCASSFVHILYIIYHCDSKNRGVSCFIFYFLFFLSSYPIFWAKTVLQRLSADDTHRQRVKHGISLSLEVLVYHFLKIVLVLANSVDPDEIPYKCGSSSGSLLVTNVRIYESPVYKRSVTPRYTMDHSKFV